jgi:hypothetical protein
METISNLMQCGNKLVTLHQNSLNYVHQDLIVRYHHQQPSPISSPWLGEVTIGIFLKELKVKGYFLYVMN